MAFIANYGLVWAILIVIFMSPVILKRSKVLKNSKNTSTVSSGAFFSGPTWVVVFKMLAIGSTILLAIGFVVNIIDYAKLHY